MATNIDIVISDLTGYNFIVKLNWNLVCIKQSISTHYEVKLFHEFLNTSARAERLYHNSPVTECYKKLKSPLSMSQDNYYFENIVLIYNNKVLEQDHVKSNLITEEMINNNNNMSFVIVKKTINYEDDTN